MILEFLGFLAVMVGALTAFYFLLKSNLSKSLTYPMLDMTERLTERVTKTGMEMREAVQEKLAKSFGETQERLDRALGTNRQELQSGLIRTTEALEVKFQSLEKQVGLRLETIGKNVEDKLNQNLKEGFAHFEKVQQHLAAAELKLAALGAVGQSISDLNGLLKLPHLRGGFGEATLDRLLADFLPQSAYELQFAIEVGSSEKVDAIVRMASHVLPIDSKFPREQILPLFEATDPSLLEVARKTLSSVIREQARSIAKKYIRPDCGTSEMALMFLPSETIYFEVIRNGELFEALAKLKVFPVSPNTLSISLHSIAMAQEYYNMSKGVEKTIEEVKKARRHFGHFEKRFEEIGKGLKKAQDAFDTAQTHLGKYENTVVRLIGEDGAALEGELPEGAGPAGATSAGAGGKPVELPALSLFD